MKRRHGINTSVTTRKPQAIPPSGMPAKAKQNYVLPIGSESCEKISKSDDGGSDSNEIKNENPTSWSSSTVIDDQTEFNASSVIIDEQQQTNLNCEATVLLDNQQQQPLIDYVVFVDVPTNADGNK